MEIVFLFGCIMALVGFIGIFTPWGNIGGPVAIVGIIVLGIAGITLSVQATQRFDDECVSHGGHTKSVGGKGGAICVSPDGRILEW